MDRVKTALAVIIIILGLVGFYLTFEVYVVLDDWNDIPSSIFHIIGSRLHLILPASLALFSLMFELLGVYLLYESKK